MRTLTPQQKRAMARGRARAARQRKIHARQRVQAFQRWLAAGSPLASIPPIPSDYDYRIAREASS